MAKHFTPQKLTGAKIQRLGYACTMPNRHSANILMPMSHAILAEDISKRLGISSKISREMPPNAVLNIQTAGDTRLFLEMLAAVNFLFCATCQGNNLIEPKLIPKETGFFIYQMELERRLPTTGMMGAQNLIILPGGRIPLHCHKQTEEIFNFVDAVTFHINGQNIQFQENSRMVVPTGIIHGTVPSGNRSIRLFAWKPNLVPNDFYLAE